MTITCPVCDSQDFMPHRAYRHPRCTRCGSLPRNRSALLLLLHNATLGTGTRIAHFAPE